MENNTVKEFQEQRIVHVNVRTQKNEMIFYASGYRTCKYMQQMDNIWIQA